MTGDTRTRMIEATVSALQQRGVAGMSFTDVLLASGGARGAIYHHFPGGKAQIVAEAAARNGSDVGAFLAALPADSPQSVVEAFLAAVRPVVQASASGGGCAVAALTVRSGTEADEPLREVAASVFASWVDQLAQRLAATGMANAEAADLAALLITLLQGAHVMCRATGTLEPFDQAARMATALARGRYVAALSVAGVIYWSFAVVGRVFSRLAGRRESSGARRSVDPRRELIGNGQPLALRPCADMA